jgi:transposase-like protein
VDGTFTKSRFLIQLLLAVGIDANGNNIILAWALVESENQASWEYFFRLLRIAIPAISERECVLISDRNKDILGADGELGPRILRAIYCKHLQNNFTGKYSVALKALFWSLARTKT